MFSCKYTIFVLIFLANIAIADSSFEKTVKACQRLLGKSEKEGQIKAEDYIAYARKMAQQGNHKSAILGFEMALESDPSKRFELLNEYADQLSFNSQADRAIPFYQEIIQTNPSPEATLHAHQGLARAYSWTNQPEAALQEYYNFLAQEPKNEEERKAMFPVYLQLARESAGKGDHNNAIAFFMKAMETDPSKRLELLREYADQLSFNSQANEAIPLYQEVIQANLSPENTLQARLGLARAYDWTHQAGEALREYEIALSMDPTNQEARLGEQKMRAQVWIQYARKAACCGNNQEAVTWLAKTLEIYPSVRGEILQEYADQLSYNSQADQAIPLYQEILNSNPPPEKALLAHLALARAYNWTEQYEKAIEEYHLALSLDPPNQEAIKGIQEVQQKREKAKRKKQAADAFQQGLCFEKKLEVFHAMRAFKKSLCYDPENTDVQVHYAWFLHNFGFPEEAVAQLCHILTFSKDTRPIYQTLGWTYRNLGNLESSFAAFSHVYSFSCIKNPNNQFLKIANCQDKENRQKEFELIGKILRFRDWGAIQFPTNKIDSFICCNLLKCNKQCKGSMVRNNNYQSLECRNVRMLQKVSMPYLAPSQEKKKEQLNELLNYYSYMGKPDKVRAVAQFLIWNNPEDYYSYLLYINALTVKKKYRSAICEYLLLIKKLPGNAFLYFRLGETYEKVGLLNSAKYSYELSLYFDENTRVRSAYTRILAKLGCCQKAFSISEEIHEEDKPFLSKTLSLAEMNQCCGCFSRAAYYYREVLQCFPYNRPALYGLLQTGAFTGNIADTHFATQQLYFVPFQNWKEARFFYYYKPPQINFYVDYFKDNTGFKEFDSGITYDFYKNHNLRIMGDLLYSNYQQVHFDRIDRFAAVLYIDKLCDNSEINLQFDDYFYKRINMPPDHISSEFFHMIMPTTSIRPVVPPTTTSPPLQPVLDEINAIANSPVPFRHSKNSINYYANYQHFWTNLNVNFGVRYYDVIDTVSVFGNDVFNYALQYGAVALNIKTQDFYGSFFYSKNKWNLQGNVIYGRYSLNNNKQSRWVAINYSLMNLPEVSIGYAYFFLNFTTYAPFFIENGYFQRAYYDPKNFEVHTAVLSTRFTPTDRIEYRMIGYLFYTPKTNCMGKALEIDFRYLFNEHYSLAFQFSCLQQNVSLGRDGILDGYHSLYALLNLKYGF